MSLWQSIPPIRIKDVGVIAPERGEAVDGVRVDVDGCFGGDVIASQAVVGDGFADGHGDWGDVAEGFAADVVEVVEVVSVEFGEAVDVVAGCGVEHKWVVLFDFCADAFLDIGVGGEEVDGPSNAGGGGVVSGAEECHYLVAHCFERKGGFACSFQSHVVLNDERDDVFVFCVGFLVLLADDVGSFAHDDVAALKDVPVHFCREVLGKGDEGCEAVEDAGLDVEGEDEAVGFTDGGFGVFEGVKVGAEPGFADDVEGGAVEPFEDFDGHAFGLCNKHVSFPELGEEQGFAPENRSQGLD